MDVKLTKHAAVRIQQRGISPLWIVFLEHFGQVQHASDGTHYVSFKNRKLKTWLCKQLRELLELLESGRDVYFVKSADGWLITCGHAYGKQKHNPRPAGKRRRWCP